MDKLQRLREQLRQEQDARHQAALDDDRKWHEQRLRVKESAKQAEQEAQEYENRLRAEAKAKEEARLRSLADELNRLRAAKAAAEDETRRRQEEQARQEQLEREQEAERARQRERQRQREQQELHKREEQQRLEKLEAELLAIQRAKEQEAIRLQAQRDASLELARLEALKREQELLAAKEQAEHEARAMQAELERREREAQVRAATEARRQQEERERLEREQRARQEAEAREERERAKHAAAAAAAAELAKTEEEEQLRALERQVEAIRKAKEELEVQRREQERKMHERIAAERERSERETAARVRAEEQERAKAQAEQTRAAEERRRAEERRDEDRRRREGTLQGEKDAARLAYEEEERLEKEERERQLQERLRQSAVAIGAASAPSTPATRSAPASSDQQRSSTPGPTYSSSNASAATNGIHTVRSDHRLSAGIDVDATNQLHMELDEALAREAALKPRAEAAEKRAEAAETRAEKAEEEWRTLHALNSDLRSQLKAAHESENQLRADLDDAEERAADLEKALEKSREKLRIAGERPDPRPAQRPRSYSTPTAQPNGNGEISAVVPQGRHKRAQSNVEDYFEQLERRKKDPLYANKEAMRKGATFTRHNVKANGRPTDVALFHRVRDDTDRLYVVRRGQALDEKRDLWFDLGKVTDVYLGKQTPAFRRHVSKSTDENLCFSLSLAKQTLDFEARSKEKRLLWVVGIMAVVRERNPKHAIKLNRTPLFLEGRMPPTKDAQLRGIPVQLQVRAARLPALAQKTMVAKRKPLVRLYEKDPESGKFHFVAATERAGRGSTNPSFTTKLNITCVPSAQQTIALSLSYSGKIKYKYRLGYAEINLHELIASPGDWISLRIANPQKKSYHRKLVKSMCNVMVRVVPGKATELHQSLSRKQDGSYGEFAIALLSKVFRHFDPHDQGFLTLEALNELTAITGGEAIDDWRAFADLCAEAGVQLHPNGVGLPFDGFVCIYEDLYEDLPLFQQRDILPSDLSTVKPSEVPLPRAPSSALTAGGVPSAAPPPPPPPSNAQAAGRMGRGLFHGARDKDLRATARMERAEGALDQYAADDDDDGLPPPPSAEEAARAAHKAREEMEAAAHANAARQREKEEEEKRKREEEKRAEAHAQWRREQAELEAAQQRKAEEEQAAKQAQEAAAAAAAAARAPVTDVPPPQPVPTHQMSPMERLASRVQQTQQQPQEEFSADQYFSAYSQPPPSAAETEYKYQSPLDGLQPPPPPPPTNGTASNATPVPPPLPPKTQAPPEPVATAPLNSEPVLPDDSAPVYDRPMSQNSLLAAHLASRRQTMRGRTPAAPPATADRGSFLDAIRTTSRADLKPAEPVPQSSGGNFLTSGPLAEQVARRTQHQASGSRGGVSLASLLSRRNSDSWSTEDSDSELDMTLDSSMFIT